MTTHDIRVEPFQLLTLLECHVHKEPNEHIIARVSGYLVGEDAPETILNHCKNKPLVISLTTKQGSAPELFFQGKMQSIMLQEENGLRRITVEAMSNTMQMDQAEKIRTFQQTDITYHKIAGTIQKRHGATMIFPGQAEKKTSRLLVQYRETDWTFLKRLASHLNTVVVPNCTGTAVEFSIGMPKRDSKASIHPAEYKIVNRNALVGYQIKTTEQYELCAAVKIFGQTMKVYSQTADIDREELTFTYLLMPDKAFETKKYNNSRLTGAALLGKVTSVRDDKIRVDIRCDNDYTGSSQKWYQYATVYSSPNGTGWYCMPEKGDTIRLYFPDDDENNAFTISTVHVDDADELRTDPDIKSIRTIHDKEIRFTPSQILITNNKGMSISLDDKKGIIIESDKDIIINSGGSISASSESDFVVSASGGVTLQQDSNTVLIKNGITQQGFVVQMG